MEQPKINESLSISLNKELKKPASFPSTPKKKLSQGDSSPDNFLKISP